MQNVKRLNVVVPYRERQAHLKAFVPLLRAYFARDKIDHVIPYRVFIVEQENGLPFNRGAINNIGFVLGREESDYRCSTTSTIFRCGPITVGTVPRFDRYRPSIGSA
jgi:hypothetical protein